MRKYILPILAATLLTYVGSSYAGDGKHELAVEYLKLSKTKETFDMTIGAYVNQVAGQNPKATKEVREMFNKYMVWGILKEPTTKIVVDSFSIQELKDINNFYKSKSGRSFAEKSQPIYQTLLGVICRKLCRVCSQNSSNKANQHGPL